MFRFLLTLEYLRKRRSLTREELALLSGVSENTIHNLEARGSYRSLFETLILLAVALDCHPSDLVLYPTEEDLERFGDDIEGLIEHLRRRD